MHLAIIFNKTSISGRLTKFFTGCYAYHTAWVDLNAKLVYDMQLTRRRRHWPQYDEDSVLLFDFPQVTIEYQEEQLSTDTNAYGFVDYLLFGLRPLFHLFGRSTRNAGGVICSEMCNKDLIACGVETPFQISSAPPSPCDIYKWVKNYSTNS